LRPRSRLRFRACAGALGVVCACGGAAPALAQSQSAVRGKIPMRLADERVGWGKPARVSGRLAASAAGRAIALEFSDGGAWRTLATGKVGRKGRYRLAHTLPRSGAVRVTLPGGQAQSAQGTPTQSKERRVTVAARVGVAKRRLHIRSGRRTTVAGTLRPGTARARVALQIQRGKGWRTIDTDRTGARGRYVLRDRVRATMSARVRVVARGRDGLASARRTLGRLNVYRVAYASWYGPGLYGNPLGCGGTLSAGQLGVAHKSLPCGTMVTFRHSGRSVRVPVIDRGPYVGGREFDLTAATANRIGFSGHGSVLVTK
jgi:peptidoglycan lytic transglycosylase